MIRSHRTGIPDHNAVDIVQFAFSVDDSAVLLGFMKPNTTGCQRRAAAARVRRLIRNGKIRARHTGATYIISGAAIKEFLDGSDEPLHANDIA